MMVVIVKIIYIAIVVVFIAGILGCTQAKDFNYGIKQINALNSKYNTTMETYPQHLKQIDSMSNDLNELRKIKLDAGQEPFNYIIDYRLLNLEAEKLFILGQKYGNSGTTKYGFGCKPRPLIIESASLRNMSALKGFEAVDLLREFIAKYPKESKLANLSEKNALFSNATFYEISQDARRDSRVINNFCPKNVTLELYQQEFRKKTNLSEEYIGNLTYDEAANIWKGIRGIG